MKTLSFTFFVVAVLVLCIPSVSAQWNQQGSTLSGEAADDRLGHNISLHANRLALGAFRNDANGMESGHVRVFEWNGTTWQQLGSDIDGETAFDFSGYSVSLHGNKVAIGAYGNDGGGSDAGHTRIYQWNGTTWSQLGKDIDGEAPNDWSGWSVSLHDNRVAIGAPNNDGQGSGKGHVRVYEWNGTSWGQMGSDIDGENNHDDSGFSVSLGANRVAIGATKNDGAASDAGHVRVYEWNGTSWGQMGSDIDGEAQLDNSGWSVSVSKDRVAIGARYNDGNGMNAGHARVYEWDAMKWKQLGNDIDGEAQDDWFGNSVSLAGNRLAVGAPQNDGNGNRSGSARIYDWDGTKWTQLGADLDGEAMEDRSAFSVSLYNTTIAIGASDNDAGGANAGSARVFTGYPTSVNKLHLENIYLSSDPLTHQIFIVSESRWERGTAISIIDMRGRELSRLLLEKEERMIEYPTRNLASGTYFVHITSNRGSTQLKFIKQ